MKKSIVDRTAKLSLFLARKIFDFQGFFNLNKAIGLLQFFCSNGGLRKTSQASDK
jgi:hypothetical protein